MVGKSPDICLLLFFAENLPEIPFCIIGFHRSSRSRKCAFLYLHWPFLREIYHIFWQNTRKMWLSLRSLFEFIHGPKYSAARFAYNACHTSGEWKIFVFFNPHKFYFISIRHHIAWQGPSIGLDNGLAPNRRQAIIWTNADPIHWRIYAAPWWDESQVRHTSIANNDSWLNFVHRISSDMHDNLGLTCPPIDIKSGVQYN